MTSLADMLTGGGPNAAKRRSMDLHEQNQVGREFLSSFGEPTLDALERGYRGEATPQDVAWEFLTNGPVGPFGMARAPLRDRLAAVPQEPTRDFLPSDFRIHRSQNPNSFENWFVQHPSGGTQDSVAGVVEGRLDPASRTFRILGSGLEESARGQGIGSAMYRRLIDEAHRQGHVVASDRTVSPSASRIYEALRERGYDVQINPRAVRNDRGGYSSADNAEPVFRVLPPTNNTKFGSGPPRIQNPIIEILRKYGVAAPVTGGVMANALAGGTEN